MYLIAMILILHKEVYESGGNGQAFKEGGVQRSLVGHGYPHTVGTRVGPFPCEGTEEHGPDDLGCLVGCLIWKNLFAKR